MKNAAHAMVVQAFRLVGLTPAQKAAKVAQLVGEESFWMHYKFIDKVSCTRAFLGA
jgi:hypothetical protein